MKTSRQSIVAAVLPLLASLGFAACAHVPERRPASRTAEAYVEIKTAADFDRVFVISDVHGMYDPLRKLLKAAKVIDSADHWSAGKSLLVITGDSIDKGPESLEVLALWMNLSDEAANAGGRVVHTLGNHEAELLANPTGDGKAAELEKELDARGIKLSKFVDPSSEWGKFLRSEPAILRVGKWAFFHSGFIPDKDGGFDEVVGKLEKAFAEEDYSKGILASDHSILEMKDWDKSPDDRAANVARLKAAGFSGVVFGHQPKAFHVQGRSASAEGGRLIKIDNGMSPEGGSNPGSLLVFEDPSELDGAAVPKKISVIDPSGKRSALLPAD